MLLFFCFIRFSVFNFTNVVSCIPIPKTVYTPPVLKVVVTVFITIQYVRAFGTKAAHKRSANKIITTTFGTNISLPV